MSEHIVINPSMLVWARERAGLSISDLEKRFPKLASWESGNAHPTFKQLEDFANATHIPIGYIFLPEPITEPLPIADFRSVKNHKNTNPSVNLLDTLYLCQERQDWYREYARINDLPKLPFIGSVNIQADPVTVAESMRKILKISLAEFRKLQSWEVAQRELINKIEESGILVMISSIVGNATNRHLHVKEFRGFALTDDLAPLIFINGSDSKAAQMFTLGHELAHLWLGKSGISNSETGDLPDQKYEQWCNAVAAEFLVPLADICAEYNCNNNSIEMEMNRLSKLFRVSGLVILRRFFDAGLIEKDTLRELYNKQITSTKNQNKVSGGGGDFYPTLTARTSKRFAKALIESSMEGRTLLRDAYRMLGIKSSKTFFKISSFLGIMNDLSA